jgi:hypothetical protein
VVGFDEQQESTETVKSLSDEEASPLCCFSLVVFLNFFPSPFFFQDNNNNNNK